MPVLNEGWTPSSLRVFTDFGSVLHVAFGAVVSTFSAPWGLAAAGAFEAYEIGKAANGENSARIAGTFLEFAIGIGVGVLLLGRKR